MVFAPITCVEVSRHIKCLINAEAEGTDGIVAEAV